MLIGSSNSFVGTGYVGALDGETRFTSGELLLNVASVTSSKLSIKSSSGLISFIGSATSEAIKYASGGIVFDGSLGAKQYSRTRTTTIEFLGTAGYTVQSTDRSYFSVGSLLFNSSAIASRGFIIGTAGELAFSGSALLSKRLTKFPVGELLYNNSGRVNRWKTYTASADFTLKGIIAQSSNRIGSAVWYANNSNLSLGTAGIDSSIWEAVVPVAPETDYVPVNIWSSTGVSGGAIVGGGRVW